MSSRYPEGHDEHLAYGDFHGHQNDGQSDEQPEGQRGFLGDAWRRLRPSTTEVEQQHDAALAVCKPLSLCYTAWRHQPCLASHACCFMSNTLPVRRIAILLPASNLPTTRCYFSIATTTTATATSARPDFPAFVFEHHGLPLRQGAQGCA